MRKVIYSLTNSLDNYIARADGGADWILMDDEVMQEFPKLFEKFDTVLLGRKTFDHTYQNANDDAGGFMGMKTYVFSRTLQRAPAGVTIVANDVGAFVNQLKQENGKDIWLMGGGELAATLLEEKLIDEIDLTIQPVLLGTGVPLFPTLSRQVELALLNCKTYKSGLVGLTYRVKP